jgi:hypothetical protein
MILARTTSRYGDVYFPAIALSLPRSSTVSRMTYGLFLGIALLPLALGKIMPKATRRYHDLYVIVFMENGT